MNFRMKYHINHNGNLKKRTKGSDAGESFPKTKGSDAGESFPKTKGSDAGDPFHGMRSDAGESIFKTKNAGTGKTNFKTKRADIGKTSPKAKNIGTGKTDPKTKRADIGKTNPKIKNAGEGKTDPKTKRADIGKSIPETKNAGESKFIPKTSGAGIGGFIPETNGTDGGEPFLEMEGTDADGSLLKIEGRNAVLEAFRSGRTIDKLFVLDGCKDGPIQTILREAKKQGTVIHFVGKDRLNQMSETKKHQGVVAVAAAYGYASVEEILAKAEERGEPPFLILLDNIEDPHNLGAIIRTANLAGAHGVIIPKRRASGLTATVVKASAGAINYTPVAKVTNLSQTIKELKGRGVWFVCADMSAEPMYSQNLTGPIGLVVGNEGEGVSRLVKENCDFAASIPMKGDIGSLNASAATAVLAYEIVRQRMQ